MKRRNITSVIQAIKNVIPENYQNRELLIKELDRISNKKLFLAPEIDDSPLWKLLDKTLFISLFPIEKEWEKTIGSIMRNEVDYRKYLKK